MNDTKIGLLFSKTWFATKVDVFIFVLMTELTHYHSNHRYGSTLTCFPDGAKLSHKPMLTCYQGVLWHSPESNFPKSAQELSDLHYKMHNTVIQAFWLNENLKSNLFNHNTPKTLLLRFSCTNDSPSPKLNRTLKQGMDASFNTMRPRQIGRHFADDIFKWIFLNENVWILIKISLKFAPKGPINNSPSLVQLMAWCRLAPWFSVFHDVPQGQWVNAAFNMFQLPYCIYVFITVT